MPLGTFTPLDPADRSPRYFARPIAFDCECPQCGRLFMVGPRRRDNDTYNRVTSELHCRPNARKGTIGCGKRFLIGMIAWNLDRSNQKARPADQRPNARQLAELRQNVQGIWARTHISRNAPSVNTIQDL